MRVYTGGVQGKEEACPALRALNARPGLRPSRRTTFKPPDFELFALAVVMRNLDRTEFAGISEVSSRVLPSHPGLARWAEHAVAQYLAASSTLELSGRLLPDKKRWVEQTRLSSVPAGDPAVYEMCAWGRGYATPDGSVRELRLPLFGTAGVREREPAEIAMVAHIAAYGERADEPEWGRKHEVLPTAIPQRVRVVEVGCLDGSAKVLFDGPPEETEAPYKTLAAPRLRSTIDAIERRPGSSCVKCRLSSTCPALPRVPGLLGIADTSRPRRTLSVTDLRRYDICPTQEHLRRLHLPYDREIEHGPHVRRGHAVHAWLQRLHERSPRRPCTADDAPPDRSDWRIGDWHLTGADAELGTRLIARHAAVCPLKYADSDAGLRIERTLTFHDTDADTLVVAKPDLLYLSGGSWVWREVKSTKYRTPRGGKDILEQYPQAALALILLSEEVFGGNLRGSRVELEILRPSGSDLELITPNQADRVAKARDVIRALATPWHGDPISTPKPGKHCARCEVARWCPAPATGAETNTSVA
ncbi:PD-(D/E)XK nuclease family protein [Kitasatospora sp. NPDC001175]|uniref:PD-(D/E)XK nuclease family protein n=1 Tax=Kitasatospora sp. NPDC001175 TaxID=3157103 RepID=UPI003D05B40E